MVDVEADGQAQAVLQAVGYAAGYRCVSQDVTRPAVRSQVQISRSRKFLICPPCGEWIGRAITDQTTGA
jgi:hypothetical protein